MVVLAALVALKIGELAVPAIKGTTKHAENPLQK
jgi:hypothetical protein